jgi:3-hydroxyisobutyrate dehydrogenase-like beta-hydroxyacid dehydrogenase
MSETKLRVGFIGIGAMGTPMSQNILNAGFPLTVYDRLPARTAEYGRSGVPVASSCAEVAQKSDVVITMIGQVAEELEAVLGANGVLEGAHPGLTLIDSSTVGIVATQRGVPRRDRIRVGRSGEGRQA